MFLGWAPYNFVLFCTWADYYWGCKKKMHRQAQLVVWPLPLSWCTCACESASALSQYQQAVFHHSVTEAHEIRAESTQNNHTELWDNPEPKHQRETGGHCFVYHPTRIRPEGKHRDEMCHYCPTWLAREKQDVRWVSTPEVTGELLCHQPRSKQWLHLFMFTKKKNSFYEEDKCIKSWQFCLWDEHWNGAL